MVWFHPAAPIAAPATLAPAAPITSTAHEESWLERMANSPSGHLTADYADAVRHEGLGAMFGNADTRAATLDRVHVRRELAPMFTVRAADAPRDHLSGLPNTITNEEFEKVTRTYSDIRRGNTHLQLDTNDIKDKNKEASVRAAMLHDIARILQTPSGRSLIDGIAYAPAGTSIHDTLVKDRANTSNAEANADSETYDRDHGASPDVTYTPGDTGGVHLPGIDRWRDLRSDVALYHELTHALHLVHGTFAQGKLDATTTPGIFSGDHGINNAEAQATGLYGYRGTAINENRYRAERRELAASGVGVVPGDATMVDRDHYVSTFALPPASPTPVSPPLVVPTPRRPVAHHHHHRRRRP